MTPRQHGLGELVRPSRHQQEHGVGRRVLEDLQQRVGGRRREPIGLADDEDLPSRLGGRPVRGVPNLVANRVDVDIPALWLDDELVRVAVVGRKTAVPAMPTSPVVAEEGGDERPRGQGLPRSLGPRQDVGVVRAHRGALKERDRSLLGGNVLEHGAHDPMLPRGGVTARGG